MSKPISTRLVRPSRDSPTSRSREAIILIVFSAAFLLARYRSLPWLLPVSFQPNGYPNGWQYKTYWRVLLPVFVQLALASTLGTVGVLLLSRSHGVHDEQAPDVKAAATAAETVALLALIWVVFQAYVSRDAGGDVAAGARRTGRLHLP